MNLHIVTTDNCSISSILLSMRAEPLRKQWYRGVREESADSGALATVRAAVCLRGLRHRHET